MQDAKSQATSQIIETRVPPTVLIIVDQPKWALDHMARNLQRVLSVDFNIVVKYLAEVTKDDLDQADLIQVFYWMQIKRIERNEILLDEYLDKLLLGVAGHVDIEGARREPGLAWLRKARAVFVLSQLLYKELQPELDTPLFCTPIAVDTNFFYPSSEPKESAKLRVGWAGSLDNHSPVQRGFYDLIVPAINSVANTELVTAIRSERWRSPEEMRDFYQSLDVYLCASRNEGGPIPCLEAAACGIPVVTTRVGCMPELIVPGVNGLFVEQDVSDIAAKLSLLRDDSSLRKAMSSAIRESIQAWDWQYLKENYRAMYQAVLSDSIQNPSAQAHLSSALRRKAQNLENEIAHLNNLAAHQKSAIENLAGQLTEVQHIANVASREVESLHHAKFYKAVSVFWKWRKRIFGR